MPPNKRLTLSLPQPVWDRLAQEAHDKGVSIGTLVKDLLLARDRRQSK